MIYQSAMDFSVKTTRRLRGSNLPQNNFSKVLLAAVEEGLSSLGDSPKQAILFHLESSFMIKKEEIPTSLTEFTRALEGIFGPGASYLEKLIARRLYEKLGLEFANGECWDFMRCVDSVKKHLVKKGECVTR
jgi:hypothetical protein